ncbi:NADH:ubiquinone oxidoreductase subunit NDUFA12 [Sphingomonas prati]|uniref:NADH:ubiquinone oxidoreductase subunit n=1 Tax=Sphingomonas prati TaxID=1843237 RepID=A0A7W9BPN0_9SPHN|nr:NADH:ubiquinone oxidoreductase subunit NDUFA12 [Sphingomonas prati]MBB5727785.1 NADH:ubiquinone oxidoreductase subunit [Sphingomonas prati]GGE80657.1 NADH:ubiquinone oxidoreductase subunit NDUFA12 [Sphingomonas prati]
MTVLGSIFTWWNGATIGTRRHTKRFGGKVGQDTLGNVYFQAKKPDSRGQLKRWVIYEGANDASRVPPEWHGWLHNTIDAVPDQGLPPARVWEKEPLPNLTGTRDAYRPAGSLDAGGRRAAATGDYEAWSPDQA